LRFKNCFFYHISTKREKINQAPIQTEKPKDRASNRLISIPGSRPKKINIQFCDGIYFKEHQTITNRVIMHDGEYASPGLILKRLYVPWFVLTIIYTPCNKSPNDPPFSGRWFCLLPFSFEG